MEETFQQEQPKNKKFNLAVLSGVGVVVLLLVGGLLLTQGAKEAGDTATLPQSGERVRGVESEVNQGENDKALESPATEDNLEQDVTVEAGSFYYAPDEIRVKKGQTIRIILSAKDAMHDFNIDELGVKIPVTKAGETAMAQFVANVVGEFEYYCSVGQHRLNGQTGKLIIEE